MKLPVTITSVVFYVYSTFTQLCSKKVSEEAIGAKWELFN